MTNRTPPTAPRRAHAVSHHGITLDDPYAWLKDAGYPKVEDPEILEHLTAENAWFEAWMAPHRPLVDELFAEMKARLKEDDQSVPTLHDDGYLYWWAFEGGAQYRRWYRRLAPEGEAELLVDEPAEAEGKEYFRLGTLSVSPDGRRLAWSADSDGSERFTLRVRDLLTGEDMETVSARSLGGPVWQSDSRAFAFTEVNDQWRPERVMLHRLGADPADAELLYQEADPSFFVGIGRSQDRSQLIITAADHVTSDVRLVPADDLAAEPVLVSPRQTGREYNIDVAHDRLWIRTNDEHVNFRIATAPLETPGAWETLIAGSDNVYIRGHSSFARHLAISERVDGLDQIRLHTYDGDEHRIAFPEASYTVGLGGNPRFDPPACRLGYESMVTPATVFDYDPEARQLTVLKVQEVPSGYDASRYVTERRMVAARDGTSVPVSIVYAKGFPMDGSRPLYLYGYGAYGHAMPPGFSTTRLSLIDRGWAYAIAHIRGGDDLGYRWYLDGKGGNRTNTFHDFVDIARALADASFTRPGRIAIAGGSAGGTLMGAVVNEAPELFGAVAAHVPFVDVLNTMLDASLPLTPIEWPEWGNPIEDADAFAHILSYSPYENLRETAYPPMLVTAGLNDPRVTYWEPAKWVARLRATRTNDAPLLLKTNMGAGHGGKSGRWNALEETAEEFAFMLAVIGKS